MAMTIGWMEGRRQSNPTKTVVRHGAMPSIELVGVMVSTVRRDYDGSSPSIGDWYDNEVVRVHHQLFIGGI